jgi:ectoine hydroxylase-related dioxygenase (phytanoyl-CoA dioxygenase family)
MLNQNQLEFFNENGYLHIPKVFDQQTCAELINEAADKANGFYTNYLNFHLSKKFQEIHTGKILCDIGDSILGRAIPIGSIFFFCKPGNPLENGSTWHQDNYAGKSTPNSYLNVAVSLDHATKENGSLMVIPGSHKLGDLPCNPKPNFSRDDEGRLYNSAPIGNDCEIPDNSNIVQLEYDRGDVLVLHGLTIHKAEKNPHPTKWRRTMYFVYVKDGEPFWPGWTAKRSLLERYDSAQYKK